MKLRTLTPPLFIFFTMLLLYCYCMPPTVYWQDAGIYLAGLRVEGNVYPPGFPLYMIVGKIWTTIIPFGSFTQKVHLLSAVFGALTSSMAYVITKKILNNKYTLFKRKELDSKEKQDQNSNAFEEKEILREKHSYYVISAISCGVSLMVGLNFNLWAQSINAEVYSLHAMLFVTILYLVIEIGEIGRIEKNINSKQRVLIILTALVYGLSFANHPMTVILIPFFLYLLFYQRNLFYHLRLISIALVIFVFSGLLPYLYLPVTASHHPILNWGNPSSINRFITHVTGKTYLTSDESFVFTDITRYQAAFNEFLWEFGIPGLILGVLGLYYLYKRDRQLGILFILIFIFHTIFAVFYKQTTEYNSWLIPAHIVLALFIGIALFEITSKALTLKTNYGYKVVAVIGIALFSASISFHWYGNFLELNRSNYYYAQDFGENILRNMDPNSLIIMTGDQESSTTLYLQTVLGFRKDIITFKNIEADELIYPEGRAEIRRRYPSLELPALPDAQDNQVNIGDYYNQLISANIAKRSVYIMSKNIFALDTTKYKLTPAAAMYKIIPLNANCPDCREAPDEKYWKFEYHDPYFYTKKERPLMSLKDQTKPGGINRVQYIQHMINFELQAWKNLGDAYVQIGECKKAVNSYNKMIQIQKDIFEVLPQIKENIKICSTK